MMVFASPKLTLKTVFGFEVNGQKFRVKHAIQAQNIFCHIVRKAEEIKMVINQEKNLYDVYLWRH